MVIETYIHKNENSFMSNVSCKNSIFLVSKEIDIFENYTPDNAGIDLYSLETVTIKPFETKLVSTGVKSCLPMGFVLNVYPRSSLPLKTPLTIANNVGIIDSSYRGEIKLLLKNLHNEHEYTVQKGIRYAQMVLNLYIPFKAIHFDNSLPCLDIHYIVSEDIYYEWDKIFPSNRGTGGFGSTGTF